MRHTLLSIALLPGALLLSLVSASTRADSFEECLEGLQQRARNEGVSQRIVDEVIPALEEQARVLELDRKQPEFIQTFGQYFGARVTEGRVERGRKLLAEKQAFLDELSRRHGIPGRYLVAFWGLETNFGSYLGSMPTLDSLATLACDQRRSKFFSEQLITALKLLDREGLTPADMRGSWAGAMGHTQFMPSTYQRYAIDGDGDGRIDLWGSVEDALASGANYLQQLGWRRGFIWGREVRLPADFSYEQSGLTIRKPLDSWTQLGLRQADGSKLPRSTVEASLLVPAGHAGPAFLVYQNFRVIMGWNRSEYYAIAVGHLADRIGGAGGLLQPAPAEQKALSRDDVAALQRNLKAAGFGSGAADGIFGPATRRALSQFQASVGLIADGFPDSTTLDRLAAATGQRPDG